MFAARVSSPKQFEIIDIDMPVAQDGQCLIKLERWSVCGSDIRHGYGPVYAEEEYPMRLGAPCHETVGTIIESKSDKFNEGQRVIVLPGSETGALVEYMAGQEDRMVALPDDGTSEEWLMCQPSGTVLYSVQQAGTVLGKSVMVMGQGSIGLSFTAPAQAPGRSSQSILWTIDLRSPKDSERPTPSTRPKRTWTRPSTKSPKARVQRFQLRPPDSLTL